MLFQNIERSSQIGTFDPVYLRQAQQYQAVPAKLPGLAAEQIDLIEIERQEVEQDVNLWIYRLIAALFLVGAAVSGYVAGGF